MVTPVLPQSLPTSAYIYRHPLSRPRLAFLTPPPLPSPQSIELLIAFFHVEVSHFLQLCQGSPEPRHGWLLRCGVGGRQRGGITNQEAVRRRAPSLSPSAPSAR